jgi:hypothetical protein
LERDEREMSVGISRAIALADESISNNNLTRDDLRLQVVMMVEKWLEEYNNSNQKKNLTT